MISAADIHARLGPAWPAILLQLGIPESYLQPKKPGPCVLCGGRDRWVFDNRRGRGDYFCRQCGPGDGFKLLQRVNGWTFSETRQRVLEAAGLRDDVRPSQCRIAVPVSSTAQFAQPPRWVLDLRRESCAIGDCEPVIDYLRSRGLLPLPEQQALRAHPGADYFQDGKCIGRFPALVAPIQDISGALVTVHLTYVPEGQKLSTPAPRKILSPLTGRIGCATRLAPLKGDTLGVAEGIETALSATSLYGVPTWAALSASLLARFEPPAGVVQLNIYADRDEPGLLAAGRLMERLQGRIRVQLCVPAHSVKDFNAVLLSRYDAGELSQPNRDESQEAATGQ